MEPDFEAMVPGLPATEADVLDELRADLQAEGSTIANQSPFSPFFLLMGALLAKPLLYLRGWIVGTLLPGIFAHRATESLLELRAADLDETRKPATKAVGNLTFSRATSSGDLPIPLGTIVESPEIDGVIYRLITTAAGEIPDGETEALVAVEAEAVGAAYNLGDGYYSILPVTVPGVTGVANAAGWLTSPGTDIESDADLQQRLVLKWQRQSGWHTEDTYRSLISDVAGIDPGDIFFDTAAPRGPGSADAYILTESGPAPQSLADQADDHINVDGNHGLGDDLQVHPMPVLPVAVDVQIAAADNVSAAGKTQLQSDVEDLIRAAFRESAAYPEVERVTPFERVSRSGIGGAIHAEFGNDVVRSVDWLSPTADPDPEMELPVIARPTFDAALQALLDNAGAADNGGGLVGLPATGHGLPAGATVIVAGTGNYDGTYVLDGSTSTDELVITAAFQAETFAGTETVTTATVDKGSGKVGIAATAHGLADGTRVVISGTDNYDGQHTLDADSSTDEIVIAAAYVAESMAGTETAAALVVEVL